MVDKPGTICRTCLTESSQCVSIYESNNDCKYVDFLKEFVGLEMRQEDNLPSAICDICSAELTTVVSFISKCRASDEKLKEALDRDIPLSDLISKDVKEVFIETVGVLAIKTEENDSADDFLDIDAFEVSDEIKKEVKKEIHTKKIKKKTLSKEIKCQVCGLKTSSRSALIVHKRTHTGARPYVCSYCNKSFSLKGTLKEHTKRKHTITNQPVQKNCICDFCGQRFFRKSDLKVHVRTHTKEKPYQCKYCPRNFSQLSTLIQHTRIHTGDRPYPCHVCEKRFISRTCLKKHLISHTTEKNFKCHICNKAVKSRGSLNSHLLLHTSEKRFSCEKCGLVFTQKGNLKGHMQAMHSERAGTCEICKKDVSDIAVHNRMHSGEKPFNCTVCEKKFSHQKYLKSHLKLHIESNKYACKEENCDAAFPMQRQLDFHVLKSHRSYFPYACKLCSKGYYRISDLNKHKNSGNCKNYDKNGKDYSKKVKTFEIVV